MVITYFLTNGLHNKCPLGHEFAICIYIIIWHSSHVPFQPVLRVWIQKKVKYSLHVTCSNSKIRHRDVKRFFFGCRTYTTLWLFLRPIFTAASYIWIKYGGFKNKATAAIDSCSLHFVYRSWLNGWLKNSSEF